MGGGEGGQEGGGTDGNREWETGRGNLEGGNEEGKMGKGATGTGRGWQWGGGQREEEMERGALGKGDRSEGGMGKEMGDGEKTGQEEGRFHRWISWDAWVDIGYKFN